MMKYFTVSEFKYYLYIVLIKSRFTRVINILFIVNYLKFSIVEFSLLQSVFLLSQLLTEVPAGTLSDILERKKIIIFGLLLLVSSPLITISTLVIHQAYIFYILMLVFILEGVGNAFLSGADDALFFEALRNEHKEMVYSKIRGRITFISNISLGLATLIGGYMYIIFVATPYIFQAIMLTISIFIIQSIDEPNVKNDSQKTYFIKDILFVFWEMRYSFNILFMFVFTSLIVAIINVLFALLPVYLSQLGISDDNTTVLFLLYSLVGGVVAMQSYRISKLSIDKLVGIIFFIVAISLIFQFIPFILTFIISLALLYIVIDIIDPIVLEMLQLWVKDESRTTIISGLSFSVSVITMIVHPIGGYILEKFNGKIMVIFVSLLIMVIITVSYFLILKSNKKQRSKQFQ